MKLKKIRKLKVGPRAFSVKWDASHSGGSFDYADLTLNIGTYKNSSAEIFEIILHELTEMVCCEMSVRLQRPDCTGDYIFVYDHRQHTAITSQVSGLLLEFIE